MSKHEDRGRAPRRLPPVPVRTIEGNAFPFADIPEIFPELEALPATTLQHLLDLDLDALAAAVEIAIRILDAADGDLDLEDNNDQEGIDEREDDDCDREEDDPREDDDPCKCEAHDDIGTLGHGKQTVAGYFTGAQQRVGQIGDRGAGDPDDAEEDNTGRCGASDPIEKLDPHH